MSTEEDKKTLSNALVQLVPISTGDAPHKMRLANGEELVLVAGGYRPRSLVHAIPAGAKLHVNKETDTIHAILKDGSIHHFPPPSPEALEWLNHPDYPERLKPNLAKLHHGDQDA